jgi:hypothetical protein
MTLEALMLIPFAVEMPVEAFLAARGRVPTGRPDRCPACDHPRLTFAGWWTRLTRRGPVDIHRVACAGCRATHSLWPDALVARRMDLAELIGVALTAAADGTGHRPIAARLGLPAATVRGWLRAFRRRAEALTSRLLPLAASAYPIIALHPPRSAHAGAVAAVHALADALERLSEEPVAAWRMAVTATQGRLLG